MVASRLGSVVAFRQLTASGADRWSREVAVAGTRRRAGGTRLAAWGAAAATGAAAALLAACSSATPQQLGIGVTTAPAPVPVATSHTVSMTAGGRTHASLDVLTGTTVLTIGTANFGPGGSLLTVTTPAGSPVPQLSASDPDGTGNPTLVDLSAPNAPAVTVTLNSGVSWHIDLDGGASRTDVDLRGGQLSGIAFNAGSNLVTLALPQPHGSVPVQMIGGASDFQLSLPTGVQARVTAGGGASVVSLEGQQHTGVEGGSVFATAGWAPGVTGFDIDATAGVSQITVTARPS
jgi:hypothetical protein